MGVADLLLVHSASEEEGEGYADDGNGGLQRAQEDDVLRSALDGRSGRVTARVEQHPEVKPSSGGPDNAELLIAAKTVQATAECSAVRTHLRRARDQSIRAEHKHGDETPEEDCRQRCTSCISTQRPLPRRPLLQLPQPPRTLLSARALTLLLRLSCSRPFNTRPGPTPTHCDTVSAASAASPHSSSAAPRTTADPYTSSYPMRGGTAPHSPAFLASATAAVQASLPVKACVCACWRA